MSVIQLPTLTIAQEALPPIPGETTSPPPAGTTSQPAPGTPAARGSGGDPMLMMILMLIVVMILFTIFSSRRERKRRETLISSIKKHDRVQTIGGVIGSVVEVKPDYIVLKVDESSNTRITFARSAVQQVLSSGPEPAPPKSEQVP